MIRQSLDMCACHVLFNVLHYTLYESIVLRFYLVLNVTCRNCVNIPVDYSITIYHIIISQNLGNKFINYIYLISHYFLTHYLDIS